MRMSDWISDVCASDLLRRELVEIERRAHAAAAFVHEGRGLEQQHALAPDAAILNPALKLFGGHAESVNVGDDVGRHEADLVAVPCIFDRKSVVAGESVSVSVHFDVRRIIIKKKTI